MKGKWAQNAFGTTKDTDSCNPVNFNGTGHPGLLKMQELTLL